MTYQKPQIASLHLGRKIGAITSSNEDTDFPLVHTIDDRNKALFRFNDTAANNWLQINQGITADTVNAYVIPSGHNLFGATLKLESSATGAFTGEQTLRDQSSVTAVDTILKTFTANADAYQRLTVIDGGTQWELGEWVLTSLDTINAAIDPNYTDKPTPNFTENIMRTGESFRTKNSESKRTLTFSWNLVSGTDLTIFQNLLTNTDNGIRPFWFVPPDTSELPIPVQMIDYNQQQQRKTPSANSVAFKINLGMLELLT